MQASVKPSRHSLRAPFSSISAFENMTVFKNMIAMLEQIAPQHADKTAFAFLRNGETPQGQLTYSQLQQNAQRIAAYLQQYAQQGDRIVLMLSPGLDYISSFFACLYAGCVAVPAYPPANRRRDGAKLDALLADANPSVILTSAKEHQRLADTLAQSQWQQKILSLDEAKHIKQQQYQPPNDINLNTLAFLQYTSGSTGNPKGVMVSHGNLLANLAAINKALKTDANTKCATWLPPYHDMGLIGTLLSCVFVGGTAYIMEPVAFLQQPYRWLKAISDYKITHTAAPNFAFQLAVDKVSPEQLKTLDLSSWQLALTGAEPIRHQTLKDFATYFASANYNATNTFPAYGLAECTLFATGGQVATLNVDSEKLAAHQVSITKKTSKSQTLVSCGSIGFSNEMAIVNPKTRTECKAQSIGEIWLRGPSVAQGYWQNEQASKQTFNAKLNAIDANTNLDTDGKSTGWLRTGDLGFIYQDQLYVTGRIKDLIIIRGRNLYPQDIEQCAVSAHDDLLNDGCAAIAIEGDTNENSSDNSTVQKLVLIHEVSRRGVKNLDLAQTAVKIRRLVNLQFAVNVDDIIFIRPASLARTSSGKIQHSKAKTVYIEQQFKTIKGLVAPEAIEVSQIITALNQHLGLARGRITAHTAFADLGLDSLAIIDLTGKLSDSLARQIDPMLMWDYPTIGQLCDHLNGKTPTDVGPQYNTQRIKQPSTNQDIAIIGMAVQLPKQINSLDSFWQAMIKGQDIIAPMPANRLTDWTDAHNSTDDSAPEIALETPQGGFIEQADQFDPNFFAISAKEAVCIDPQQRLLLQTSWHALEDASLNCDDIRGSNAALFIGLSTDDYGHLAKANPLFNTDAGPLGLGNARSVAAGRIAYFLGCHGPAMAVDTACSSSAYAIHLACQAINNNEVTLALAGGANLILQPQSYAVLHSLNALSPNHQCRTFYDNADGYVRGEGSAMVVLAPAQYAIEQQHNIYAVINATHVNQDGHSNGLTAPNGTAQRTLLRTCLQKANLQPSDIGFIETHGTGTPLGDPIEVNAIADVYGQQPLLLGAIKSQFGHLEAAAGVLSLIKTALAISKQSIPANIVAINSAPVNKESVNSNPNPRNKHIKWQQHHIRPVTQNQAWPKRMQKQGQEQGQSAAVSAFGLSGTNVHIILSPARLSPTNKQAQTNKQASAKVWPIVKVSAQSKTALLSQIKQFEHTLKTNPSAADALISASQYRSDFDWRASFIAGQNINTVTPQFVAATNPLTKSPSASESTSRKIVFMFTGQGSIYSQMGKNLYQCAPVFAARIDHASNWLTGYLDEQNDSNKSPNLAATMFDQQYKDTLLKPRFAQLSLYVLQIALVDWLASLSITPQAIIGHSIGEFAAAYCAGVISAQSGYSIVYTRGLLTEQCPAGSMLAVKAGAAALVGKLNPANFSLDIAAINSNSQTVVSGSDEDINRYQQHLTDAQIKQRRLDTSHGFHSQLMTPMLTEFKAQLDKFDFAAPNIDWFSTLNGANLKAVNPTTSKTINSDYWLAHLTQGVLFQQAFSQLTDSFADTDSDTDANANFVEIGPKPILSALIASSDNTVSSGQLFSTLKQPNTDQQQLANTLSRLWQKGHHLHFQGLTPLTPAQQHQHLRQHPQAKQLPSYAFDLKRYWLPSERSEVKKRANSKTTASISYQNIWQSIAVTSNRSLSDQSANLIFIADDPHQPLTKALVETINPNHVTNTQQCSLQTLFVKEDSQQQLIWYFDANNNPSTCTEVLLTLKNLMALDIKRLWIVVTGLHTNDLTRSLPQERQQAKASAAVLWGACKSIRHEYPQKFASIIDIESASASENASEIKIESEISLQHINNLLAIDSPAPAYRLNQQGLMVEQLVPLPVETTDATYASQKNRTFAGQHLLITGGSGALANILCQYFLAQGASKITLASRRMAQNQPDDNSKIDHISLDVCHAEQVKRYLTSFSSSNINNTFNKSSNNSLDGIFHLAGVAADVCPLQSLDAEQITSVLAPKTHGAWHLHQYSQGLNLKHFVLFSSIASLIGYAGQTAYSAANYHLDWLASHRHQQGLPGLSINWGPWQGDGMAGSHLVNKAMSQMGINLLNPQPALDAMQSLLLSVHSQSTAVAATAASVPAPLPAIAAIIDVKPNVIGQYNNRNLSSDTLFKANQTASATETANTLADIEPWLEQVFIDALGEPIDNEQKSLPLNRLGMDSIRALDIKHAIFERTGLDLPVVQFLQGLSFAELLSQIGPQTSPEISAQTSTKTSLSINTKAPNPAPLSDPQQRLWLVNQWQQPSGLYNIHAAIKLTGKLDINRLQQVINALTARHEVLRSRFIKNEQQQPMQQVLPELSITINEHQISADLTNPSQQPQLHELLRTLAHQVFDLSQGPLWSVDLISHPQTPNAYILALTLDHIIADAWSMDVLIGDVMALYLQNKSQSNENQSTAQLEGNQLAPLDIQYKDYALWQTKSLSQQKLAKLNDYWQQNLADFSPFELSPDYPRPERQALEGRCHRFSLSTANSKALADIAAEQGVTLYVLLLTLFKLFMHQQTGEKDIAIGTDVANREQAQTRNLIGFFVNLLVLRTRLTGNPSFTQLLQQQANSVQQALAHQDLPFHRLVELLNRPRDASRSPLVQILFVLQNAQSQLLQLPDLDIETVDFDQQVCRFDMALFFHQTSAKTTGGQATQLHGHWHYATALYEPERINKLAQGFDSFIHHIIGALNCYSNSSSDSSSDSSCNKDSNKSASKPLLLEDIRMLQTPFKSTKSKAGFNRFKSGSFKNAALKGQSSTSNSMQNRPLANKPLVEKFPLVAGKTMPLVLKATNSDIDPFAWVALNREQMFADLQQHGALLFRDFGLKNAQDFERFAQSICPSLYGDYGDLPKEKQGEKIYHSTPYPKDKAILFHNESSHLHQWPTKQFFFCVKPSPVGGATPIVDCREVYKHMDKDILAQFENKHLKYVRNFSRNLDVSWQNFFKTDSPSEVEAKCQNAGISYQWLEDDGLRTEEIRRAVTVHPQSGEKSFFNQIQLHHSAFLPQQVRQSLLAIGGVENLPRHVYFGDGSEISDEVALYTLDLYERLAVRFDWQQGDLVMVDNMAVAHARDPFEGERKINVAMAEMQNQLGNVEIKTEMKSVKAPAEIILPENLAQKISHDTSHKPSNDSINTVNKGL